MYEVPIFFIHHLGSFGSRKLYQKEKKKVGVVIKKKMLMTSL
jgi:hypothetical protein